ncbi:hypothetical protein EIP91_005016 [Steccherinum ochraceum]|uniref:Protein kinase domain-containing protein n=1 Tax=Steccherinum ochraceum TaxID=92696 RepID=A0A4R0R7S8_9APHY|nr:hypothetical protein EIP91_005016 [Steccherinum ochraceum]
MGQDIGSNSLPTMDAFSFLKYMYATVNAVNNQVQIYCRPKTDSWFKRTESVHALNDLWRRWDKMHGDILRCLRHSVEISGQLALVLSVLCHQLETTPTLDAREAAVWEETIRLCNIKLSNHAIQMDILARRFCQLKQALSETVEERLCKTHVRCSYSDPEDVVGVAALVEDVDQLGRFWIEAHSRLEGGLAGIKKFYAGSTSSPICDPMISTLFQDLQVYTASLCEAEAEHQRFQSKINSLLSIPQWHVVPPLAKLLLETSSLLPRNDDVRRLVEEYGRRDRYVLGSSVATVALDHLQKLIDTTTSTFHFRLARRILQESAIYFRVLPSSYYIQGIRNASATHLDQGGFSKVYQADWKGQLVALKVAEPLRTLKKHPGIIQETICWRQVKHPNIQPFLGICHGSKVFQSPPVLVSEWQRHGSIVAASRQFSLVHLQLLRPRWILEIAHALQYLHVEGIAHGDLRGYNILLSSDLRPKLIDFGSSSFEGSQPPKTGRYAGLTPYAWQAPEVIGGKWHTMESDLYSFAGTCVELFSADRPFPLRSNFRTLIRMVYRDGVRPDRPQAGKTPLSQDIPDELWDLISRCFAEEPSARPTADHAVEALEGLMERGVLRATDELERGLLVRLSGVCVEDKALADGLFDAYWLHGDQPTIRALAEDYVASSDLESTRPIISSLVDHLNEIVELEGSEPAMPSRTLQLLIRLVKRYNILPSSYFSSDVALSESAPSCGADGRSRRARCEDQDVAVRAVHVTKADPSYAALLGALVSWKHLQHPNVEVLLGVSYQPDSDCGILSVVTPWHANGTVLTAINSLGRVKATGHQLRWITELASGLQYLHESGVVHGDVQAVNVLIDDDLHVKLVNFGVSTGPSLLHGTGRAELTSKYGWPAPEWLSGSHPRPDAACDVYSFGCTVLEICEHQAPFGEITNYGQLDNHLRKPSMEMLEQLKALAESCRRTDSMQRPTMQCVERELKRL